MDHSSNVDMAQREGNYERCLGFVHVIRKGDTLYNLSKQYHVKVSSLILANPYANIYNLQVGDTLCIPRIRPVVIPIAPTMPQGGGQGQTGNQGQQGGQPTMPQSGGQGQQGGQPMMPPGGGQGQQGGQPMMPGGQGQQGNRPMTTQEECMPEEVVRLAEDFEDVQQEEVTASMQGIDERLKSMTVGELLEEWDVSSQMLTASMDIIKIVKNLL